jgi:hypothetical protein
VFEVQILRRRRREFRLQRVRFGAGSLPNG